MVDYGAATKAGGAGAALADGEERGGAYGAQSHGGRDFGDQQGEALVEHVGQAVSHGKTTEDECPIVLDAWRSGRDRRGGCQ